MNDVIEQLYCLLRCSLDHGFILDPLGKFVNADIDLAESFLGGLEGPDHI